MPAPARAAMLAALLLTLPALVGCHATNHDPDRSDHARVHGDAGRPELIAIINARVPLDGVLTGGQPTRDQFESAAAAGYRTVINLRTAGEKGEIENEADLVDRLGMRYVHIPVDGADGLTESNARLLDQALKAPESKPAILHCGSGNRVGALLGVKLAWIDGASPEDAIAMADRGGVTRLREATLARVAGQAAASP